MGMSGAPFGQQYGQAGVQQMGAAGVNAQQLQNKTALSNNLPQFPAELKGAGSVPNMVSVRKKKTYLKPFFVWLVWGETYSTLICITQYHCVIAKGNGTVQLSPLQTLK